ncbi:MAG TPA: hypothetical protein VJ302_36430 [Blastocatellia bacterium]|nr:hypothetical protein [Blastocatellia bacterium]
MENIRVENITHDGSGLYTALFKGEEIRLQARFAGATAEGMEDSGYVRIEGDLELWAELTPFGEVVGVAGPISLE